MKLGDKDYWQVGDEIHLISYGNGIVVEVALDKEYPVRCEFPTVKHVVHFTNDGKLSHDSLYQTLFHLKSIIFDENSPPRPTSICYNYVPKREPKVMVTKLPHEFVEGEEVLAKGNITHTWFKSIFKSINKNALKHNPFMVITGTSVSSEFYCIPYKGNEHLKGEITNCESGKIPDDYVFPKPVHIFKPFDKVLVNSYNKGWFPAIFARKENNFEEKEIVYFMVGDAMSYYTECIPYEGNEALIGTTDSPEE